MMSIQDFSEFDFPAGDISHRVFKKGQGPAVVIMHELPGMTAQCISLAETVALAGFTVYLPLFFGAPGDDHPILYAAKLCVNREFHLFSTRGGSPIVDWLRALCRRVKADCGAEGVGVIGLCLTGNFALALMADDGVLAPVASEPALPFALTASGRASLAITDAELTGASQRCATGVPVMCLRFSNDVVSPRGKFDAARAAFGVGFRGIEINSEPGNPDGISRFAHSVLTADFVDREGHPTLAARDAVLKFLAERLTPGGTVGPP